MMKNPLLFLLASAAVCMAKNVVVEDEFHQVALHRSAVAIEDHPEKVPWTFEGPLEDIACGDGVLTLAGPPRSEIRMFSKQRFKSGRMNARLRFDTAGRGVNIYAGFVTRSPWAASAAWCMFNDSTNGRLFMGVPGRRDPDYGKVHTGKLPIGEWFDFTLAWGKKGAELLINGESRGTLEDGASIPNGNMQAVLAIWCKEKPYSLSIDRIRLEGEPDGEIVSESNRPTGERIPIPVPPRWRMAAEPPPAPATASVTGQEILLENRYFRYRFDLADGLPFKELTSKYLNRNLLTSGKTIFAIHDGQREIPAKDFRIAEAAKHLDGLGARVTLHGDGLELALDFTLSEDSPELRLACKVTNQCTAKRKIGVTCPVLPYLKIGGVPGKDEYFYPFESGMAGSLPVELRHPYGVTLFMQVMSVFNPQAGGGIYAYPMDSSGMPKMMFLKKRVQGAQPAPGYDCGWGGGADSQDLKLFDEREGTSLAWRHLRFDLEPGGFGALPVSVIGVNAGIWHAGLESYSAFVHTWFSKPHPTPRWWTDCYGWLSAHRLDGLWILSPAPQEVGAQPAASGYWDIQANDFLYGKTITHLERNVNQEFCGFWDFPAEFDDPANCKGMPGINAGMLGDYDWNPRQGGLEAMRREIARIHAKGSRLTFYTFPEASAKGTRSYEIGRAWASINAAGRPRSGYTADGMGWNFCPYEQGFADHYAELFARRIAESGADGLRLDVMARLGDCHNHAHAHYDGTLRGTTAPSLLGQTLRKIKGAVHAVAPEAIVTVEHASNDYLCQFHDGFLSENICWNSERPQWAHFRNLNEYELVFTRFYFPEVKTFIHGPSNSQEGLNMCIFNATGVACTPRKCIAALHTLRENGDALDNGKTPQPYIPTLLPGVFANHFTGEPHKELWTLLNRNAEDSCTPQLAVDNRPGNWHFVDLYRDEELSAVTDAQGKLRVTCRLPAGSATIFARLERRITISPNGDRLSVSFLRPHGCRFQAVWDEDDYRKDIPLADCPAQTTLAPPSDAKRLIVKLYRGEYLVDETILSLNTASHD
ncbi:MAG: hypothetical protein IJJ33_04240 [Victivallales bacterium]|nr:hypothetical protein [Victivallales bacterium]